TTIPIAGYVFSWLSLCCEPWKPDREYSGKYIGVCATTEARLDHSFDEAVDVFAPVSKLSPISCSPSRASFEAASWRVKSESRFNAGEPEILDTDLSGNNRSCKLC